jgi:hypothetical protein
MSKPICQTLSHFGVNAALKKALHTLTTTIEVRSIQESQCRCHGLTLFNQYTTTTSALINVPLYKLPFHKVFYMGATRTDVSKVNIVIN